MAGDDLIPVLEHDLLGILVRGYLIRTGLKKLAVGQDRIGENLDGLRRFSNTNHSGIIPIVPSQVSTN